jgi:hypothetical protein
MMSVGRKIGAFFLPVASHATLLRRQEKHESMISSRF